MRLILPILFLSVCYPDSENFCDSPSEEDFLSRDVGCSDYDADSFLFYVCESIFNKIIQKDGYDGVPSYSHNYIVPDTTHLNAWAIYLSSLDILDIAAGDTELNSLNYTRIESDFNGNTYHIFHESNSSSDDGDYTNGSGIYILNPNPQIDNSFIHVNHPHYDSRTIFVGAKLFREMGAKWLFIAGASRNAAVDNSNYSSSSECETQCGECSADMARTECSVFQKFHENMSNNPLSRSISIHGFNMNDYLDEDVGTILSNGENIISTDNSSEYQIPTNFTKRIKNEIVNLNIWNDSNLSSYYDFSCLIVYEDIDTYPDLYKYGAKQNPQGHWTNSSEGRGDWVHFEIDTCLRKPDSCFVISDDDMYQDSIVTALSSAFTEPYVINIPADYSSIQQGINAASDGDTVLVAVGTYVENINFNGKNIAVIGEDRETTIIDGNQNGSVVTFDNGETLSAMLNGFSITNGNSNSGGGGIYINNSSPTLKDLKIINNSSDRGGGIYCDNTNTNISNIIIENNSSTVGGGGINIYGDSPIISNTIIKDNSSRFGGGISIADYTTPTLYNILIYNNEADDFGGGMLVDGHAEPILINLTITRNQANKGDGIYNVWDARPKILLNSIVTGNYGHEVYWHQMYGNLSNPPALYISNSNINGSVITNNSGIMEYLTPNINANPLFIDPDNGEYNLSNYSTCIGAGVDSIQSEGIWYVTSTTDIENNPRPSPEGTNPDVGAYENALGIPTLIAYGCIDETACNYDEDANADDNSCIFAEYNYDCNGNCIIVIDCAGVCGGDSVLSGCDNVCNSTAEVDCAGECGGTTVLDCAGVCGGDSVLSGCDNVCNSTAEVDCAGECGGTTVLDCAGECGGSEPDTDDDGICDKFEIPLCTPVNFNISNTANTVMLSWDTGFGQYEKMQYFSGWWKNAYYYYTTLSDGSGHGLRFAPMGTYNIDSIHVAVRWDGWPNDIHEGPLSVQIYTENNDMPDELLWTGETSTFVQDWSDSYGTPGTYGWALIYPTLSNLTGEYFIFVGMGVGYEPEGLLYNWDLNNSDNIYIMENGVVSQGLGSYLFGDPMTITYMRNFDTIEYCDDNGFLSNNIYRNDELLHNASAMEYTDVLLEVGEYCYQVSNIFEGGESELGIKQCIDYQIYGCSISTACNYQENVTIDDGSCTYPEENYDCSGSCLVEIDCASECGGTAELDACDNCEGSCVDDGTGFVTCNTNENNIIIADACGECDGDDPEEGLDCNGNQLSLFNGLIPEDFNLHSIYPNPFNPVTNIIYGMPEHANVQIIVYDLSGKQIETLINEHQTPGYHSVNWNADNHPSGVYFVKIVAGDYINTQKLMLVK